MTIHHATQKKADERSIVLEEGFLNGQAAVIARWTDHEDNLHEETHPKAKDAVQAMIDSQEFMQADCEDEETLDAINAAIFGEPEETTTGTVVAPIYKERYMENASKGRGNADPFFWWMEDRVGSKANLDVEMLELIAEHNEIDHAKYNRTTRGWEGRLRMTIGNMLRNRLFRDGHIMDSVGKKDKVDADWVAEVQKEREEKAEQAKRDKEAAKATAAEAAA